MTAAALPGPATPGPEGVDGGGPGLKWRWVAVVLVILVLVWFFNHYRAWAAPLLVAGAAALLTMRLLGRGGRGARVRGTARLALVVAVFVALFMASGGWAYTYGGGSGLTVTLVPPAGPLTAGDLESTSLTFTFTNTGSGTLRFDPSGWRPASRWSLHVVDPNGTEFEFHPPPPPLPPSLYGGYPDAGVELGPGASRNATAEWPSAPMENGTHRPWATGNYTAYVTWSETSCGDSWLPCVIGDLRSDDVAILVV
jgi:hypothetical protein